jgi:hypothetical protein
MNWNSNVDKLYICIEHMNITQKLVSVIKQTWTPYQYTLQIELTYGGFEPHVSRTVPIVTQVACKKTKITPTPKI